MEILEKIKTDREQIFVDDIENPSFMFFGQYNPYDYRLKVILPYRNVSREIPLFASKMLPNGKHENFWKWHRKFCRTQSMTILKKDMR